ncbi:MAG: TRAP transporter substrate-binding protein DctP [Eubacteriales bacterium]|nr:TRAP transporter substrate-binding protein DctP [Eubacteriales bacterium]
MKKFIAVSLASAMALSLAACGGSSSTAATTAAAAPAATQAAAAETKAEAAAPAAGAVALTVAYADAEDSVFGKGVAAFSSKLEELSGGTMTCTVYPNGTLGSISEVAAMIQQGTCDVSPIVTSSLVDFCPDLGVFDLPFLFTGYDDARTVINGAVGDKLAGEMENVGMHVGSWMTMGFRETTSSKPINAVADFKGLKIRTQSNEVHQAIFNSLGASATVISFSELYTAMEQKTVDAQENPYVNIANNAYYEVQDYLVETNHVFQYAALLVSAQKYNSLTDEQKAWVDEAAAAAADAEWDATMTDNETAKQTCIDKGMTFVTLDHDELLAATSGVYDQYKDKYGELLGLMGK